MGEAHGGGLGPERRGQRLASGHAAPWAPGRGAEGCWQHWLFAAAAAAVRCCTNVRCAQQAGMDIGWHGWHGWLGRGCKRAHAPAARSDWRDASMAGCCMCARSSAWCFLLGFKAFGQDWHMDRKASQSSRFKGVPASYCDHKGACTHATCWPIPTALAAITSAQKRHDRTQHHIRPPLQPPLTAVLHLTPRSTPLPS